MPLHPRSTALELEQRLRSAGSPERAAGEKRYLKSDLKHFGTTVGENRREVKALAKRHPDLTHAELTQLVRELWSRPAFECRLAATLLLVTYPDLIGPDDLELLNELIRDSRTWALVDPLAGTVLGQLLLRRPDAAVALDAWVADPDFWVRRAALLSQLAPLKHGADPDRFAQYADAMLDETEFFIRKAIGWVLREFGKRDPAYVYEWLAPRIDRASGVTVREAVKHLETEHAEELLTAYRARRPRRRVPNATRAPRGRPRNQDLVGLPVRRR